MVGGAVENQEDILPGKLSRQGVEEDLKARRIRSRHDQIDTSPILWRDRAVQIDVFANELGGDFGPDADRGPARPRPVDPAETRFIGKQDPQATAASACASRAGPEDYRSCSCWFRARWPFRRPS